MIGIAFSLGFLFGPMIGAAFSVMGRGKEGETSFSMFQYPAFFSLAMASLAIVLIVSFLPETLPPEKRVSYLSMMYCNSLLCMHRGAICM